MVSDGFAARADLPLVVVGNWDASRYGRALKESYASSPQMRLLDPVYDLRRVNWLRCHASLYIHGHSAGGTNPSLVEAMCIGLPVLAFDCVYNLAATANRCLYLNIAVDIPALLIHT